MKRSPDKIEMMRRLSADGATVSQAAHALGVAIGTAQTWAADERITFPTHSQASKRAWADPEVRAKMSAASKRALADPEVRAKMSAASKRAWADPEVRAKMSAARKRAWADPEVRAKMKAARRGIPDIVVPAWVPASLQDEFLDVAVEQDEFAAARHIRALKREEAAQQRIAAE